MDTWNYSEANNLIKRFPKGTQVYIGGGRKEGFDGLIGPGTSIKRNEKLSSFSVCHVGLAIMGMKEEDKMLIIGRQSPNGPVPTLMSAIEAGVQQYINPVATETIQSVMAKALKTTIANELGHMAGETSFDTEIIKDCAIPIEMVQEAIDHALDKLPDVMTFATENCMSTKSLILLKLSQLVQEWSLSGEANAPSPKQAKAFATGCHTIIAEDIHFIGYGVLNNPTIREEMRIMLEPNNEHIIPSNSTPTRK